MKNGMFIREGRANINPANKGAIAAPIVRATPVMPAAADRSSGRTTAMVYDCLAGTSIWLMLKRRRSTATASGRFGIRGYKNEQNVRRKVSENHGLYEAEVRGKPGRQ